MRMKQAFHAVEEVVMEEDLELAREVEEKDSADERASLDTDPEKRGDTEPPRD